MKKLGTCSKCGEEGIRPRYADGNKMGYPRLVFDCSCGYRWFEDTLDMQTNTKNK
jgi:hypothetical protein